MGTAAPPRAFIQSGEQVPGCPGQLESRSEDFSLPCSVVTPPAGPELPGIIIYSFPNKSCPSFCLLCTPVLWAPTLGYWEGSASEDQVCGAFRICINDANRTKAITEWACGANDADLLSVSLPPGLAVRRPGPRPRRQVGRCVATITCYYDFLGNVYIFTITQPLSFIFHENWHEINDQATEETEHHATLIY